MVDKTGAERKYRTLTVATWAAFRKTIFLFFRQFCNFLGDFVSCMPWCRGTVKNRLPATLHVPAWHYLSAQLLAFERIFHPTSSC